MAEALREAEEAEEEADAVEKGKPVKPKGSGDPDPNPPDDPDPEPPEAPPGGGGGGGKGGDSSKSKKLPDAVIIYVRSENTVWAWNRYLQEWVPRHFKHGPILEIKKLKGGLLVVAKFETAIWDANFGQWLKPLYTEQELIGGN